MRAHSRKKKGARQQREPAVGGLYFSRLFLSRILKQRERERKRELRPCLGCGKGGTCTCNRQGTLRSASSSLHLLICICDAVDCETDTYSQRRRGTWRLCSARLGSALLCSIQCGGSVTEARSSKLSLRRRWADARWRLLEALLLCRADNVYSQSQHRLNFIVAFA